VSSIKRGRDGRRMHRNSLANLMQGKSRTSVRPGNTIALKHGGYASIATERLDQKQREVFDGLADDAPLRASDGGLPREDALALSLLARALCRLEDVEAYHARSGWLDGRGKPRPSVDLELKLRREALDIAEALGMSPRSRVRLGLDIARTKDALEERETARAARERLDARAADVIEAEE
jgi:hypothetical protein